MSLYLFKPNTPQKLGYYCNRKWQVVHCGVSELLLVSDFWLGHPSELYGCVYPFKSFLEGSNIYRFKKIAKNPRQYLTQLRISRLSLVMPDKIDVVIKDKLVATIENIDGKTITKMFVEKPKKPADDGCYWSKPVFNTSNQTTTINTGTTVASQTSGTIRWESMFTYNQH